MIQPQNVNGVAVVKKADLAREASVDYSMINKAVKYGDLNNATMPGYIIWNSDAEDWLLYKLAQKRKPGPIAKNNGR